MERDRQDNDRSRTLTRRALVVGGAQLLGLGLLTARLYQLQVLDGDRYRTMADENRITQRLLAPSRGLIVDRFGRPLAINRPSYRAVLVKEEVPDLERTLAVLRPLLELDDRDLERIRRDIKRNRSFMAVTLTERLDWSQVTQIEINAPDLPGVSIEAGESRHYPLGTDAAHLLGYVGAVSRAQLQADSDPVASLPGYRMGQSGIERQYEHELRGTAGTSQVEVNAFGRTIRELSREAPQAGRRLALTLDAELQQAVMNRLRQEQSASAVVMDVHDGSVYALASNPGYDSNLFSGGIPADVWEELLANPAAPLVNKAIAGQYPPGSTFKMITALAALSAGIIQPGHTEFCPGHMELGGNRFHCWKTSGHGKVDLTTAMAQSCDVWFYQVALKTGIDKIAEMGRAFALGARTGIDLPRERPGLMPDKAWKRAALKEEWRQGETLISGIGQGRVLTTPLQLAVMTARLANGGKAVTPTLTQRPVPQGGWPKIPVDPAHLSAVLDGMNAVTNDRIGTAWSARILDPALAMAGKTGTAQVFRITREMRAAGIRNETLPWLKRHHALFVGYAPVTAPQYAVAVVVEHGGGGASTAAPVAHDILMETQRRNPARPGEGST